LKLLTSQGEVVVGKLLEKRLVKKSARRNDPLYVFRLFGTGRYLIAVPYSAILDVHLAKERPPTPAVAKLLERLKSLESSV
jgi:hypothetical protein